MALEAASRTAINSASTENLEIKDCLTERQETLHLIILEMHLEVDDLLQR
jgi:hypothetical protein